LLDALDSINIHMLPFFSQNASIANNSWPLVLNDLDWFIDHGKGKKMYFDEVCCNPLRYTFSGDQSYPRMGGRLSPPKTFNRTVQTLLQISRTNMSVTIFKIYSLHLDETFFQDYFVLLDKHCEDLKAVVGGGVGWFAHIYSDNQEPGE